MFLLKKKSKRTLILNLLDALNMLSIFKAIYLRVNMKWWNFDSIKLSSKTVLAGSSRSVKFPAKSLGWSLEVFMLLRTFLLNVSFYSSDLEIQLNTYKHKSSPQRALSELFSRLCILKMCIKLLQLAYLSGLFSGSTGCSKSWEICSLICLLLFWSVLQ